MLHNKDKQRLFDKYFKRYKNIKGSAQSICFVLDKKDITPKRVARQMTWSIMGLQVGSLLYDTANREGFMRRLLREAEESDRRDAACKSLAAREGLEWFYLKGRIGNLKLYGNV